MAAAIGFKASVRVRVPGPSGWAGRTSQSDHISSPWATVPGQTFKLTAGPCGYDSESASESEARFPGSPSAGGRRRPAAGPGPVAARPTSVAKPRTAGILWARCRRAAARAQKSR